MLALETAANTVTSRALVGLGVSVQGSCPHPSLTRHRGEQPVAGTCLAPAFGFRVAGCGDRQHPVLRVQSPCTVFASAACLEEKEENFLKNP